MASDPPGESWDSDKIMFSLDDLNSEPLTQANVDRALRAVAAADEAAHNVVQVREEALECGQEAVGTPITLALDAMAAASGATHNAAQINKKIQEYREEFARTPTVDMKIAALDADREMVEALHQAAVATFRASNVTGFALREASGLKVDPLQGSLAEQLGQEMVNVYPVDDPYSPTAPPMPSTPTLSAPGPFDEDTGLRKEESRAFRPFRNVHVMHKSPGPSSAGPTCPAELVHGFALKQTPDSEASGEDHLNTEYGGRNGDTVSESAGPEDGRETHLIVPHAYEDLDSPSGLTHDDV